jgi:hypothetical protein
MEALTRVVAEECETLITTHGLRQRIEDSRWGGTVVLEGDLSSLELFYGNPEYDFTAGIRYRSHPRRSAMHLWAVLEALGVDPGPLRPIMQVDDAELRRQVRAAAELVSRHWEALDREPTEELRRAVGRIVDRYDRRVRARDEKGVRRRD